MAGVAGRVSKMTAVRLPLKVIDEIDTMVGKGYRSRFIATAIEKELMRQKRLAYIQKSEGLFQHDLVADKKPGQDDTLAFINRLRASDVRTDK
jgi:Arc/MetJ-type ribon-helix-helix transcriptional regulator